jgi:hypothetical protein
MKNMGSIHTLKGPQLRKVRLEVKDIYYGVRIIK